MRMPINPEAEQFAREISDDLIALYDPEVAHQVMPLDFGGRLHMSKIGQLPTGVLPAHHSVFASISSPEGEGVLGIFQEQPDGTGEPACVPVVRLVFNGMRYESDKSGVIPYDAKKLRDILSMIRWSEESATDQFSTN